MRSAPAAATGDSLTLFDTLVLRFSFKARATGRPHDSAKTGPAAAGLGSAGLGSAGLHKAGSESAALELSTGLRVAAVLFVTVLTALASQISVPVPFTFQPMVVLLGGAALGARLGMSAQILYLLVGLAGLPVFAASPVLPQGALRLLGPTGGYL